VHRYGHFSFHKKKAILMLKKTSKNNRSILFTGKLGLMLGRWRRWWKKGGG
jgi:hypothetical protein